MSKLLKGYGDAYEPAYYESDRWTFEDCETAADNVISDNSSEAFDYADTVLLKGALVEEFKKFDCALRDYFSEELATEIPEFLSDAERLDLCERAAEDFMSSPKTTALEIAEFLGGKVFRDIVAEGYREAFC